MKHGLFLVRGGLCIAICLLSFLIFRGMANLLNAIVIPLAVTVFTNEMSLREKSALFIALGIFCFVFFPLQILFLSFYILMSFILNFLYKKPRRFLSSFLIFTLTVICFMILAVYGTDIIFKTQIVKITTHLMGGNPYVFLSSIVIQSLIISAVVFKPAGTVLAGRT